MRMGNSTPNCKMDSFIGQSVPINCLLNILKSVFLPHVFTSTCVMYPDKPIVSMGIGPTLDAEKIIGDYGGGGQDP